LTNKKVLVYKMETVSTKCGVFRTFAVVGRFVASVLSRKGLLVCLDVPRFHSDECKQGMMNFSTPYCSVSSNIDALMDIAKFGSTACLKVRQRLGSRGVTAQQANDAFDEAEETIKRSKYLSHTTLLFVTKCLENVMSDKKVIGRRRLWLWSNRIKGNAA
jgi:hypothetical protein